MFKSGNGAYSWFHCLNKQCKSKVRASYENLETVDEDEPEVEGRPIPHVLKESGLIHPPDFGKRMEEVAMMKLKEFQS